jgi:hypothetical protein
MVCVQVSSLVPPSVFCSRLMALPTCCEGKIDRVYLALCQRDRDRAALMLHRSHEQVQSTCRLKSRSGERTIDSLVPPCAIGSERVLLERRRTMHLSVTLASARSSDGGQPIGPHRERVGPRPILADGLLATYGRVSARLRAACRDRLDVNHERPTEESSDRMAVGQDAKEFDWRAAELAFGRLQEDVVADAGVNAAGRNVALERRREQTDTPCALDANGASLVGCAGRSHNTGGRQSEYAARRKDEHAGRRARPRPRVCWWRR